MIIKYYKYVFQLVEPLSLGNGENKYSDRDLLRDGEGKPFIPGSSLCGVYRSVLETEIAGKYFGFLNGNEGRESRESSVLVYDAVLRDGRYTVSIRDSVGLDEFKTAKEGAKFDFELVNPGAVFVTYLEQRMEDEQELDIGGLIAEQYLSGRICLGHKSMRGYGRVEIAAPGIWTKTFVLPENREEPLQREDNGEAGLEEWLAFDMYDAEAFGEQDLYRKKEERKTAAAVDTAVIELELKQKSGISIRRYTTELKPGSANQPDYTQMFYIDENGTEIPCIPGTTWAGAFRHHMMRLLSSEDSDSIISRYFGMVSGKQTWKSKVRFSESRIMGKNLTSKVITRTAIDRFTGGVVDGALYTEKTFLGGETMLTISFLHTDGVEGLLWNRLLAAAVTDLDRGFLSVGGLTSVGRGLFEVERCRYNGVEIYSVHDEKREERTAVTPRLYQALMEALHAKEETGI